MLRQEIKEYYGHFRVNNDLLELRNLVEVADLIIRSAQGTQGEPGLHYTIDFPNRDERFQNGRQCYCRIISRRNSRFGE